MTTCIKFALTFAIVLGMAGRSTGQEFVAESALPTVEKDAFYRIALPPGVTSYSNVSFSNLRIVNENGVQIPFLLREDRTIPASTEFVPYVIEEQAIIPDSCTVLVLRNDSNVAINNISLLIRNAAVSKEAALYGSDDKKTWYALKDKFALGYIDNDIGTAEVKIIDFPTSEYTYYKIWINDATGGPLNIVQAGFYKDTRQAFRYEPVPVKAVAQEDDSGHKKSYIRITLDTMHLIDRIDWEASGAPLYQRTASLYAVRPASGERRRRKHRRDFIANFQINSRHEKTQRFPTTKTDNLLLEVINGDNPPLVISDLRIHQVSRYLVAWLKKGDSYTLKFGGEEMPTPVYDLRLFQDSIPQDVKEIQPGEVQAIGSPTGSEQATIFTTRLFVWIAILVVIIVLGVMSVRMLRQTKSEPSS